MPDFVQRSSGARFTEGAKRDWVRSGRAKESDFAELGAAGEGPAPPEDDGTGAVYTLKATGARVTGEVRRNWIRDRRAKPSDFARADDAPAPAPSGGPTPIGFQTPAGVSLSPEAAAGYLSRGLCKAEELSPVYAPGDEPAAPAEEEGSGDEGSEGTPRSRRRR